MRCNCGGEMRPAETVDSDTAARVQKVLRCGVDRRIEPLHVREYAHADA